MSTSARARANDFTGRQRQDLLKQHSEELAARKDEIALSSAAEVERIANEVVDLTKDAPTILDDVEDLGVGMADNTTVMRVNEDIEQMTLGKHTYNFKVGAKYKVPKDVYTYLDHLGYVWH